jgi:hypothetical protein
LFHCCCCCFTPLLLWLLYSTAAAAALLHCCCCCFVPLLQASGADAAQWQSPHLELSRFLIRLMAAMMAQLHRVEVSLPDLSLQQHQQVAAWTLHECHDYSHLEMAMKTLQDQDWQQVWCE